MKLIFKMKLIGPLVGLNFLLLLLLNFIYSLYVDVVVVYEWPFDFFPSTHLNHRKKTQSYVELDHRMNDGCP